MNILETFLVALLPVIELRGAIPFGVTHGVNIWVAFGVALAACVLVCVVLLALLVPVFDGLKRIRFLNKPINYLETKFQTKSNKIKSPLVGLFLLSAFPIPLTGVWTASAIAVFLGLPYLKSLTTITLGTVVSGLLIVGVTLLFGDYAIYIFHGFLGLAIIIVISLIVAATLSRSKNYQ